MYTLLQSVRRPFSGAVKESLKHDCALWRHLRQPQNRCQERGIAKLSTAVKAEAKASVGNPQAESDTSGKKKTLHYGHNVPLTAAQLRHLQVNGQPVRFMVNPPGEDPSVVKNVYLDTATLTVLYEPPIGLTGAIPEHSNLSTVMILDHPSVDDDGSASTASDGSGDSQPDSVILPDYYTASSYIIPTASLVIASHPNEGHYDVTFEANTNPSQIYYDYGSFQKRYALYEVRTGVNGTERIYLKPFKIEGVPPPRDKIIRGTLLDPSSAIPDEAFVFQAFQASVSS